MINLYLYNKVFTISFIDFEIESVEKYLKERELKISTHKSRSSSLMEIKLLNLKKISEVTGQNQIFCVLEHVLELLTGPTVSLNIYDGMKLVYGSKKFEVKIPEELRKERIILSGTTIKDSLKIEYYPMMYFRDSTDCSDGWVLDFVPTNSDICWTGRECKDPKYYTIAIVH